jgi:putative sigma-54 modulation protein
VRTIVKGKNYEVPSRVRSYAERKLTRLERFLDDRSDATVELSVERHRSSSDSHIVEVTLVIDGQTLRGKAAGESHKVGIDAVVDKIERRAVDFLEKPRARERSGEREPVESEPERDDVRGQIVKVKRFDIEPMFEEDAVARMEELGHEFFVFVNAENERVAILYRRRDGDYGLLEPMIGGDYTKGGPPGRTASRSGSGYAGSGGGSSRSGGGTADSGTARR